MKGRDRIFICYRREGGAEMARLVRDSLKERGFDVFMDVEDLKSGEFNKALLSEIEGCKDVIVILSPGAIDRCYDEGDWLRWEISHALRCEKNIVPVSLRGFAWPQHPLPEEIQRLPYLQGVEPSHALFKASIDKLVELLKSRPARKIKRLALAASAACLLLALAWLALRHGSHSGVDGASLSKPDRDGWLRLFDGKTLSGWTAPEGGSWEMKDGVLTGEGATSLLSPGTYTNFIFKSEVRVSPQNSGGIFFSAGSAKGSVWGYRATINNTATNDKGRFGVLRTGSLRCRNEHDESSSRTLGTSLHDVLDQLVPDATWFTQQIVMVNDRIIVRINDKITTDFLDERENAPASGHIAFHQVHSGKRMMFRNSMIKPLPQDQKKSWETVLKELPDVANSKPYDLAASHCWVNATVESMRDGAQPKSSSDASVPAFTWWDHRGTTEWVQYTFDKPRSVSGCAVYWMQDKRGIRPPQSWRILYRKGAGWEEVPGASEYGTKLDCENRVSHQPVETTALRLEARLQPDSSAGIYEWRILD